MRAGLLDRRITIEKSLTQRDGYGQPIDGWAPMATVSAQAVPFRGQERFVSQEQQPIAEYDIRFRIRYRSDVLVTPVETLRVRFEGRLFDVTSVQEVGRRVGLNIYAKTRSE